jgi:hypothetical protein
MLLVAEGLNELILLGYLPSEPEHVMISPPGWDAGPSQATCSSPAITAGCEKHVGLSVLLKDTKKQNVTRPRFKPRTYVGV